jgi:Ulp1 family protease
MPLCGGTPLHWVLAWIDFGASEIGLFDSMPELNSSCWAEPVSEVLAGKINI